MESFSEEFRKSELEIEVLRRSRLRFRWGRIFSLIPTSRLLFKTSRLDDFLRPLIVRTGLLLLSSTLIGCVASWSSFAALEVVLDAGRRGKAEIDRGRRSAVGAGVFRELESLILSDRFRIVPGVAGITLGLEIDEISVEDNVLRFGSILVVAGAFGVEVELEIRRGVVGEASAIGGLRPDSVDEVPDLETWRTRTAAIGVNAAANGTVGFLDDNSEELGAFKDEVD